MSDNIYDAIFQMLMSLGYYRNQVDEALCEADFNPYTTLNILRNDHLQTPMPHNDLTRLNQDQMRREKTRIDERNFEIRSRCRARRLEKMLIQWLLSKISREEIVESPSIWYTPVVHALQSLGLCREHARQALTHHTLPGHCPLLAVVRTWAWGQRDDYQHIYDEFHDDYTQSLLLCIPSDFRVLPEAAWSSATVDAIGGFGFSERHVKDAMQVTGFDPYKALKRLVHARFIQQFVARANHLNVSIPVRVGTESRRKRQNI